MKRSCLKCGHEHPTATGAPDENCPMCGANYRKVEAMWGPIQPVGVPGPSPVPKPLPIPKKPVVDMQASGSFAKAALSPQLPAGMPEELQVLAYVEEMRRNTLYPAFRRIAAICHYIFVAVSLLVAMGGLFGGMAMKSFSISTGSLVAGVVIYFVSKGLLQASAMIADLCDTTVRTAARSGSGGVGAGDGNPLHISLHS